VEDRIEQEIVIKAGLERVWSLASRPGWWVPDDTAGGIGEAGGIGSPGGGEEPGVGSVVARQSARWGRYLVEVVNVEPMSYAAFRWASEFPGETPAGGNSTLVEIFVKPLSDTETNVTVVESGFTGLPADRRASAWQANTGGWREELADLQDRAERPE
jgi:uncharacterized protein YndB with AHSA1/START domain